MGPLPPSVDEMLRGADEDFDRLRSEIAGFFQRKPYRVVTEHNGDFRKHAQRMGVGEPIPKDRWGRLFYVAVQELRSALDHMIYAIAIQESGQDPPPNAEKLAFPVMTNPPDVPMWKVALLSDDVKAAIKALQPDPNHLERSTVWHLEKMNSSDKHRIMRLTLARYRGGIAWSRNHGGGKITNTWHLVALEDETPFHELTTEHPAPNVEVGVEVFPEVSIERVGGNRQPEDFLPLEAVIGNLRSFVHDAIRIVGEAAGS